MMSNKVFVVREYYDEEWSEDNDEWEDERKYCYYCNRETCGEVSKQSFPVCPACFEMRGYR